MRLIFVVSVLASSSLAQAQPTIADRYTFVDSAADRGRPAVIVRGLAGAVSVRAHAHRGMPLVTFVVLSDAGQTSTVEFYMQLLHPHFDSALTTLSKPFRAPADEEATRRVFGMLDDYVRGGLAINQMVGPGKDIFAVVATQNVHGANYTTALFSRQQTEELLRAIAVAIDHSDGMAKSDAAVPYRPAVRFLERLNQP